MKLKLPKKCKKKVDAGNVVETPKWGDIKIRIKGKNNKVIICPQAQGKIKINIHGDDNTVLIKSAGYLDMSIWIGVADTTCRKALFEVGERTEMNGVNFVLLENESLVTVGEDCLFSDDIEVWCSDTHSICDLEGNILNIGKSIEIGNHVWVGRNCSITKNTKIADNSIIGWCSNVTKKFEESNVVIAGNPAEVVKRNIDWRKDRPQTLFDKQHKTA